MNSIAKAGGLIIRRFVRGDAFAVHSSEALDYSTFPRIGRVKS